jgi:hypothetical protein
MGLRNGTASRLSKTEVNTVSYWPRDLIRNTYGDDI